MAMPAVDNLIGRTLVGSDGSKIGTVNDVYLDDATGEPEWLAVTTGMFGSKMSFVPLAGATDSGDDVSCQWTKDQVKDSPNAEADGALSQQEEAALYSHYGLEYSEAPSESGLPTGKKGGGKSDRGTDDAMTRSEEEVVVDKQRQQTGRARLRKYVVTENVNMTVPVQREEVRVEREAITDANVGDAMDGPEISEDQHEVTLSEEQVVVGKQTVPKERVRLDKEVVTEQEQVSEEVRKEQIEVEGDVPKKDRR